MIPPSSVALGAASAPSPWSSLTVEAVGPIGSAGAALVAVWLAAHQMARWIGLDHRWLRRLHHFDSWPVTGVCLPVG